MRLKFFCALLTCAVIGCALFVGSASATVTAPGFTSARKISGLTAPVTRFAPTPTG